MSSWSSSGYGGWCSSPPGGSSAHGSWPYQQSWGWQARWHSGREGSVDITYTAGDDSAAKQEEGPTLQLKDAEDPEGQTRSWRGSEWSWNSSRGWAGNAGWWGQWPSDKQVSWGSSAGWQQPPEPEEVSLALSDEQVHFGSILGTVDAPVITNLEEPRASMVGHRDDPPCPQQSDLVESTEDQHGSVVKVPAPDEEPRPRAEERCIDVLSAQLVEGAGEQESEAEAKQEQLEADPSLDQDQGGKSARGEDPWMSGGGCSADPWSKSRGKATDPWPSTGGKDLDPWAKGGDGRDPWAARRAAETASSEGSKESKEVGTGRRSDLPDKAVQAGIQERDPWALADPWSSAARAAPKTSEKKDDGNPWAAFTSRRSVSMGPLIRGRGGPPPEPRIRSVLPGHAPERQAALLNEVVDALLQGAGPDATYVDCTFGRGGHSAELLKRISAKGRVVAFDLDPVACVTARTLERNDPRFMCHHRPHGDLLQVFPADQPLGGVLIDLGAMSVQAEDRSRGHVVEDGPLDLRINTSFGLPASEWLQQTNVEELAWVIHEFGEDSDVVLAHRLAEAILERQERCGQYKTVAELADVCRRVKQGLDDRAMHPAKLTLQAMRCFLNHEMEQLDLVLRGGMERLCLGGRLVVISYKRKEAAQVKQFIREHEDADSRFAGVVAPQRLAELYPLLREARSWACRQVCEPIRPSAQDCERYPRGRSAVAHVLVKEARNPAPALSSTQKCRTEAELFQKPAPLPFQGSSETEVAEFQNDGLREPFPEPAVPELPTVNVEADPGRAPAAEYIQSKATWSCLVCGQEQWASRLWCRSCGTPRAYCPS